LPDFADDHSRSLFEFAANDFGHGTVAEANAHFERSNEAGIFYPYPAAIMRFLFGSRRLFAGSPGASPQGLDIVGSSIRRHLLRLSRLPAESSVGHEKHVGVAADLEIDVGSHIRQ